MIFRNQNRLKDISKVKSEITHVEKEIKDIIEDMNKKTTSL